MLLFLEIALTVAAWKRGWRGWALLPLVVLAVAAGLIGFVIGLNGGSDKDFLPFGILLDIGAVIALSVMSRRGPATEGEKGLDIASAPAAGSQFSTPGA